MRYRFVLFFCLILIVHVPISALAGNNNSGKQKITIGMIGKIGTNPVFIATYSGARVAAKELSAKYNVEIDIDWQTPTVEKVEEQAAAIDRFSRAGVNGIAISCIDANYLTPVIDKAIDKGTPVMCFDSDAPKSKRFAYFGADDIEFGKMLLKKLAAEINGKGVIAVLAGNRNALNLQRRLQGIKEELKKYPNIILSPDDIYYNIEVPDIAAATVERAQKKHPAIGGWIFIGSMVLQAQNNLKWNPGDVKVVAGNAVPAELEYVKNGYVQSLVGVNCFQMGYKTVEVLLDKILHNRTPVQPLMYTPLSPVTKKNVEEWLINWRKWLLKEAIAN
ncbi:MAG: substrate-binding domain-containing protein [Bacteroidota bacterium]